MLLLLPSHFSRVQLCVTVWIVACQASLSMGFSRQEFVQFLSCVWLFVIPWTAACKASLSFTISQSLLKLMSVESVMPSYHLILCCPFSYPQSFPASGSSHQMAKVLVLQLQPQSFQWRECYRGFNKHVEERNHFLWDPLLLKEWGFVLL